jgi:hypothetical protein
MVKKHLLSFDHHHTVKAATVCVIFKASEDNEFGVCVIDAGLASVLSDTNHGNGA